MDHRLTTAAAQIAGEMTVVPFGLPPGRQPLSPAPPGRRLVALAGFIVGSGVAIRGWRRRQPFVAALGGLSLVMPVVAVWSTTRIVGPVLPYLLTWSSVLLLPAWIGAAAALPGGKRGVAAVAAGAGLVWSMGRAPLPPVPHSPEVAGVDQLARPALEAQGTRQVRVRIGSLDQYPLAAGVLVRLEKDGFSATVDPVWVAVYGDQFKGSGREDAALWLTGDESPPDGTASRLGAVGTTVVWASSFKANPAVGTG
jgi:hypothetical protein